MQMRLFYERFFINKTIVFLFVVASPVVVSFQIRMQRRAIDTIAQNEKI